MGDNMSACKHPKEQRSLMPGGYDVACGECEQIVGRVAIFPDVVLGFIEARELLGMLTEAAEGSGVRAKLTAAARQASA